MDVFAQRKLIIPTPEQVYLEFNYAGFTRRILSALIDHIIIIFLESALLIVYFLILLLLTSLGISPDLHSSLIISVVFLVSILLLLPFFYFFLSEYYWDGQTIGKRIFRIKVIRRSGVGLDIVSCFLRNLFRLVDIIYLVGLWFVLLHRDEQRIGDLIAGTVVISLPKSGDATTIRSVTTELGSRLALSGKSHQELGRYLLRDYLARRQSLSSQARFQICKKLSTMLDVPEGSDLDALEQALISRVGLRKDGDTTGRPHNFL